MRLLTIGNLGEMLAVPKSYIYRLNYEGRIPGKITFGHRTVRYDAQTIEEWLQSKKSQNIKEEV